MESREQACRQKTITYRGTLCLWDSQTGPHCVPQGPRVREEGASKGQTKEKGHQRDNWWGDVRLFLVH